MELTKSINYLFNQVFNAYRLNLEKSLNSIGLHSGQVFILIILWTEDGLSQNEIAKKLNLSPPTINKMIKSLIESGFLNSKKSEADGRVTNIFLTEKGYEVKPRVLEIWQELERDIYSNLTETEKMILHQILDKTLQNLQS
jgi:DNA-binding MarR family transcriptional regulator